MNRPILAIVIPCYNEEAVLPKTVPLFTAKIAALIAAGRIDERSFVLLSNDGSRDNTWNQITRFVSEDPQHVRGISLSRNRGHQNALLAGLMEVKDVADVAVSADCDGQDDIDAIDRMLDEYERGAEVVYACRDNRETDTWFKRTTAEFFYRLINWMGGEVVFNHADYRLATAAVLQGLSEFSEVNLFLRGMFPLVGFKAARVYYRRQERLAGGTHYPFLKMLSFAIDGITSLSVKPIRLITLFGGLVSIVAFLMIVWSFVSYFCGRSVPGWTSSVLCVCLFGGIQLLSLGVIGEYVGKIYLEAKHRPRFIIRDRTHKRQGGGGMYKRLTFLTFLAIGILLMGLCFQGIDLGDEGFWMANAKYVFSHPEGILYSFSYYLSVLVSGVWGRYVSDTLLGYRLLAALVRMATMLMAYFCLRRFVRRGPLLVGLFWGFLLSCGYTNVLYGSMFTGLFYVSISALLILGVRALLAERSRWAMVVFAIGGFLMGVSVFVRIPNITSLGFVCVPFYALVVFHQLNFRKVSIALLPIMMGWGLGFSAVLGLIHILGHAEHFTIMMEMFREIAKGGHHSIGLLVWVQLRYYISAFFFSGIVLVAMFIGALLMKKLAESMTARGAGVLSHMLMLVGVVALFAGCLVGYNHRLFRVIPVGLFLFSFACAFVRASSELRVVWFTAFVLLGLAPLGSDVPFEANAFSLPFVMPLCVSAFWNGDANFRLAIDRLFGERICGLMIKWTLSTLAILALYGAWHDVVRDNSDRFSLNASVQIREFKGVFTTSERARALENLVLVAERILPPKDPILIFPGLSVLHAILDRPPALECSRVNLYDKSTIYNAMQKGVARVQGKFPWIIEEKWSDGHLWPLARISYMPEGSRLYSFYLQFRRFLDDYSYTIAWENEDFRIWMKNIR